MDKDNFAPIAVVVERSQNELLMRSLEDGIFRRFKEDIYSISNEFGPFSFYPTGALFCETYLDVLGWAK